MRISWEWHSETVNYRDSLNYLEFDMTLEPAHLTMGVVGSTVLVSDVAVHLCVLI